MKSQNRHEMNQSKCLQENIFCKVKNQGCFRWHDSAVANKEWISFLAQMKNIFEHRNLPNFAHVNNVVYNTLNLFW